MCNNKGLLLWLLKFYLEWRTFHETRFSSALRAAGFRAPADRLRRVVPLGCCRACGVPRADICHARARPAFGLRQLLHHV
ncbi:hypothetical protein SDC9_145592 [bioreactor metagenome]|uniref:Uncharacterized protein n=1 Tax=bioreactor metagenome TaxID=1076179 RepID=A0A645E9W2_9ZZZZ